MAVRARVRGPPGTARCRRCSDLRRPAPRSDENSEQHLRSGVAHYHVGVQVPQQGHSWLELTADPLPVGEVHDWCVQPSCGAVVVFSGTVRDHAADLSGTLRDDVQHLDYEAYDEQVVPVFARIEAELRQQWPHTGRVAILHRTGRLDLGAVSVVVGVSAPHRPEAFEAARFAIDTLKKAAPIWKRETWAGGSDWGTGAHDISSVGGPA